MTTLAPGRWIGILGGGQLGRMLAIAAARLGFHVHVFSPPSEDAVAAEVAARATRAPYDDREALEGFARSVDVVTCEFENVPAAALEFLGAFRPVRPGPLAFAVAQDRLTEKRFAAQQGARTVRHAAVDGPESLAGAIGAVGLPAILKTRRLGYDGKGQAQVTTLAEAHAALQALGGCHLVLEALVAFEAEFSVLVARGLDGRSVRYPAVRNRHEGGILVESEAPAPDLPGPAVAQAAHLAERMAIALDYVGVLACEFFLADGEVLFNEMAPRVHNSGHWTIEGAQTCQFEQHVRAIAGLPLGATGLRGRAARMRNVLGDEARSAHRWLSEPGARLHLYGKSVAVPGRKMGHVTFVDG
ncbi:MAG: 5-(carboxyamino)imidazole ribonucleotide synthase [Sphingomonadaceae bacterium]|uniref:5-(carboxyamino)imidazole ribonucleotide synthase n=1 Tax=Thermaurantiacus sp. TaxID=2820283 RepID=UPI00298F046B|nr:5-(carboxyamino)imidazole ribonucleotide synthase [Thermaurantiacus sp.]MCS6985969.1 5-(carboxyamino)imidazole ribonucleotide synthase [Sphingomonadaceae bacterium]MDW8414815.1 5-(carboxyamino)imidazole ribonucleotide synthase [Thermaurantiacus sp.]